GAELEYSKMDEARRAEVSPPEAGALYRSFLKAMADLHKAPKLDPDSPEFDQRFADPRAWQIIALRPRIDKRYHELRVAYRHVTADEDILPMFRFRILKDGPTPEEGRVFNNKAIEQIVADAFFDAGGKLRRDFLTDKKAHARAAADMTTAILTFADPDRPWAQGHFISLPHGARLGGGSERDADGNYAYGDGWAWGVMRPLYKAGRPSLEFENVGFPGFVTDLKPSADNSTWDAVCGARWNPDDPKHEPGMEVACMKDLGTVGLPERTADGSIIRSATDTTHRFLDYKLEHAVENVAIDDPRRDVHEEQGMSCHQCHVRVFGIRDVYDEAAVNPAAGLPVRRNKRLAPTFFVIVPMQRWEPYAIDFQHLQECMAAENLPKYLGRTLELGCPLRAEQR
ncbi:MAG TPA: hypothetical protein VML75_10725, partial [Kofleriaceae bacterium]|nr:hypothetical protein [Kofleriaceae bacterium]